MEFSRWLPALALPALVLAAAIPPISAQAAVTEQDFYLRSAGDLAKLCATPPSDPLYSAAIHFCEGYGVGAYQADQLHRAGSRARPLFCMPTDPQPTRNEVTAGFVAWVDAKPEVATRAPAEGVFEYLMATYPCAAKKR